MMSPLRSLRRVLSGKTGIEAMDAVEAALPDLQKRFPGAITELTCDDDAATNSMLLFVECGDGIDTDDIEEARAINDSCALVLIPQHAGKPSFTFLSGPERTALVDALARKDQP